MKRRREKTDETKLAKATAAKRVKLATDRLNEDNYKRGVQ